MAGEAGRDEQALEAGHRAQQRNLVGREGLDAGPAPGDRALGQRRIDGARDLQTSADAVRQHLPAVLALVGNPGGPASADEIGAVVELLQAQRAPEAAHHRRQARGRRIGQEHLESPAPKRKLDAELAEQRRAPGARGHDDGVARQRRAVAPHDARDTPALRDERVGAHAFLDAHAETPGRRRPGADRGDRIRLAVDRAVNATAAIGRDPGRQAARRGRVDQLHRDAGGALLADGRARLRPARVVERHPEPTAPAIARLRLELAVELGPAPETLEGESPLRGVASHRADAGRAGAGRGIADARALEHGHGHPRVGAAQMHRRAQPDQAPSDDDRSGHGQAPALRAGGASGRACRAASRRAG